MLLSVVIVLVVAQSSSEIPEGLMNNPVLRLQSFEVRCHIFYYICIKTMEELASSTVVAEEYSVWGKHGTGIQKGGLRPRL